jgi:hypothetical protein
MVSTTGEATILRHEIPATRSSHGHDCGSEAVMRLAAEAARSVHLL